MREPIGDRAGLGIAWLLVLAGPLGWLGLLVISTTRSGRTEDIVVRIPFAEPAYQHLRSTRRTENIGLAVVIGSVLAMIPAAMVGDPTLQRFAVFALAASFLLGVALLISSVYQQRAAKVSVELDASRRWVHLSGVHPAFASACDAERRERDRV